MVLSQTTLFPSAAMAQVAAGFSSVQVSGAMAVIPTRTPVLVRQDGSANKDSAPLLLGKSVMEAELRARGGIGGLLAKVESGTTHLYQYDGNGNVGQLVNASTGAIDAQYEYDAYGNAIVASETQAAGNPFRFSTKYLDSESGLYYYGYRFYDPEMGRWTNRDPIEEEGGINLYNFVNNNSINLVDPDGEIPLDTIWDLGNIVFDIAVGDNVSLAADIAAFYVPYLPAGSTKLMKLVNFAKLSEIEKICKGAKEIKVSYKYLGVADKYTRHTLPKSAGKTIEWIKKTIGKNKPSKFIPGWGDTEIKSIIEKALKDSKLNGKIKPQDLDGYIFDVGKDVGASQGKMTTKVKIHINVDGTNLHAFPIN